MMPPCSLARCSRLARAIAGSLALLGAATGVAAQSPPPRPGAEETRPSLPAARLDGRIRIDGRLDDAAWVDAPVVRDFTQRVPNTGAPATERTEARVLYDDEAVYVAMRLFDRTPRQIARQLGRRDNTGIYSDWAHVLIDSYHDRRTAFRFGVSAAGVQLDVFHYNDTDEDSRWDAVWASATTIDSAGWNAEFRIPLSQLRFSSCAPQAGPAPTASGADGDVPARQEPTACSWGINFARDVARRGETAVWAPTPPDRPGVVSRFGELRGVRLRGGADKLELLPYVSSQATREAGEPGDPFHRSTDVGGSVGADVRYRLPLGFTLSATINPDFGQVEADPAVVNLSAFEVRFDERRPFFQEGADIFRFGRTTTLNDNSSTDFFYSRRIGRAPQRRLSGPEVTYVDAPTQSSILGAAKVSGKTNGGWSVGTLAAVTALEEARYQSSDGLVRSAAVEPRTAFGVARVRRDLRGGQSVVGGIATLTDRALSDTAFDAITPRRAVVAGVDGEHTWHDRTWAVSGYLAASHVTGDDRIVATLQRNNTRLFARPDAAHLDYDPTLRTLRGHAAALSFAKPGGDRWLGSATYEETSPGFEANDAGFQTRADMRSVSTALQWRETEATRLAREYELSVFSTHSFNFGGDRLEERYAASTDWELNNFWELSAEGNWQPDVMSDRLTRGGPLMRLPSQWSAGFDVSTDSRRRVQAGLELNRSGNAAGQHSTSGEISLDMRPVPALRISVTPEVDVSTSVSQYVRAVTDTLQASTYGRRYVFSDLEQREFSVGMRVEWTFSPTLSLQTYVQPFVSTGEYLRFKELRAPRTFDFLVYGRDGGTVARDGEDVVIDPDGAGPASAFSFDEPDFTVRSLRGNAVLRWEYRPGSTLFLVWQQQRETERTLADDGLLGDFGRIFRDPASNVFAVKVTYWFAR
jgi:hypothetical protein